MKSIVTAIPLKIEFTTSFLFISLKLIGQPFFKTSFAFLPDSSMIAFEWDKSVIANSSLERFFAISSDKLIVADNASQLFGPIHKILTSLFSDTLSLSGKFRPDNL